MRMDDHLSRRDAKGGLMWGLIFGVVFAGLLYMWAPWSSRVVDNAGSGTTIGSTSPAAPTAPLRPLLPRSNDDH